MALKRIKSLLLEFALRLAMINIRWFGGFDRLFYLEANEDVVFSELDPVRHYLTHGNAEGRAVSLQDSSKVALHGQAAKNKLEKLIFVRFYYWLLRISNPQLSDEGWESYKIIKASGLFDSTYYLENNNDVLQSGLDPVLHFVVYGFKEGRNPCPSFQMVTYAIQHGIPSYSKQNPFVHYILQLDAPEGLQEDFSDKSSGDFSIEFDADFYLQKYPDLDLDKVIPSEHFLAYGIFEGRDGDSSLGGYAQWRSSFVFGQPPNPQSKTVSDQNIVVCLVYEGQSNDQIIRTLKSLEHQEADFRLVSVVYPEGTKALSDVVDMDNFPVAQNITSFDSLYDFFQTLGDENGFCGFLTIGDQLLPYAIDELKAAIENHPDSLLVYSDEEIVNIEKVLIKPLFKGCFDPDLQRSRDYMGNFLTISTNLLSANLNIEFGNWAVSKYLLVNKIMDQLDSSTVCHIPKILYRRVLQEHWPLDRLTEIAKFVQNSATWPASSLIRVTPGEHESMRLEYSTPTTGNHVSIIIPTRNGFEFLKPCIDGILKQTDYDNYELIIIDNGSDEQSAVDYLNAISDEHSNVTVIQHDKPFNYSELNNIAVKSAKGDFLAFLNNDIEVIDGGWLKELISQAARPEIGIVGALLLYPDKTIQHAGVVTGVGGVAANSFSGWDPKSEAFEAYNHTRRVSAVTGACMAMRRGVFEQVGGFDEGNLPVDFNDVDLCLRVGELGLGILFTPHARLFHHESKSRESHTVDSVQAKRFELEVQWMQTRWFNAMFSDPFYSPNYGLGLPGYDLAWPPRLDKATEHPSGGANLNLYDSHSNPERANLIVQSMGRTPSTLSHLKYGVDERKTGLSIIILNLNKPEFIIPLIQSMHDAKAYFDSKGFGLEILIGDTGSTDSAVLDLYQSSPSFIKVLYDLKYQFSRSNNQVFAQLSRFDSVLFLNNDIAFSGDPGASVFEMLEFLNNTKDAGVVGAQLLFPDKSIQHAGIGVFESDWLRGFVYHPDAKEPAFSTETFPRKMWAVTGACLMMRVSDFVSVNGFDEAYDTECQDAALCLEIRRRGLQSYVLAPGEIIHFENGTREKGSEDWPDRQKFMRQWGSWIDMELQEQGL